MTLESLIHGDARSNADAGVSHVAAVFDPVFERLERWAALVEEYVGRSDSDRNTLDPLMEALVRREFADSDGGVIGAGFVSAPSFLGWHLAWWLGGQNAAGSALPTVGIRQLETIDDSNDESFRDYTALEWWQVPERTGRRHVTGPYVDYLCTDEYTLTLTLPVYRNVTELIGVVGIDLSVDQIERELVPRLTAGVVTVTVVNASGRVVVSTDTRLATGALLRLPGLTERLGDPAPGPALFADGCHTFQWCGQAGLAVVAGPMRG